MNRSRIHRTRYSTLADFICMMFTGLMLVTIGGEVVAGEAPPLYPSYPIEYDVVGTVDAVGSESIVINDSTFRLSPDTTFNGPDGSVRSRTFKPGDEVGVIVAASEIRQVDSLWLLEAGKRVSRTPQKEKLIDNTTIQKVGEVWTN